MRIVSLLPSATEIAYAIGAGPDVVGVTFECDYPAEARGARIVSTSALPQGLDPKGIDAAVCARLARACSSSTDETRPAWTRQPAICRLSS